MANAAQSFPGEKQVAIVAGVDERSATTARAVLVGFVPGVTLTVNSVEAPGSTEFGLAVPVPVGLVGAPVTVGWTVEATRIFPA